MEKWSHMGPRLGKSRTSRDWESCHTETRWVKLRKVNIQTDDDSQFLCVAQFQYCDSCVSHTWTTLFLHPDRNLEDFSLKKQNRLKIKNLKSSPIIRFLPNNQVPTQWASLASSTQSFQSVLGLDALPLKYKQTTRSNQTFEKSLEVKNK